MLLMCATTLSAQQYKQDYVISKGAPASATRTAMVYGVMGGVTLPRMTDKSEVIDITNTAGYSVGLMWGLDLGGLSIIPELWYQHDNTQVEHTSRNVEGDLITHSIEMPVVFGMKLGPIRLNVGPSFSLMSSSKIRVDGEEDVDFGKFKSTAGYLVGLSSLLWDHVVLDLRYTGRFVTTSTPWYDTSGTDEAYEYRYYSFGFNIGYRF